MLVKQQQTKKKTKSLTGLLLIQCENHGDPTGFSLPHFAIKTIIKFINQPWSIGSPVMEVSVSSWGYPSIIHSNRIFPYKPWNTPSSYWGSPMTLETPITIRNIICINMCHCWNNNMCHPFNDDGWNHNNGLWMTTYLETNRYCMCFLLLFRWFIHITIWLFNMVMENHHAIDRSIIYFYGPSIPWRTVSHNQRVYPIHIPLNHYKSH